MFLHTPKIILKEETETLEVWVPPDMGSGQSSVSHEEASRGFPTAEDIEEIQEQARQEAYKEGFSQGRQEGVDTGFKEGMEQGIAQGMQQGIAQGIEQGVQQIQETANQWQQLISCLTLPLESLDQQVEQELVALAMAVAKHLVRRELKADPGQVIAVVREAVSVLPVSARDIRVLLHPEDKKLIQESLSVDLDSEEPDRRWRIIEDPMLTRGGCKIETATSFIDASVETRLAAIIAQVLGGDRQSDNASPVNTDVESSAEVVQSSLNPVDESSHNIEQNNLTGESLASADLVSEADSLTSDEQNTLHGES